MPNLKTLEGTLDTSRHSDRELCSGNCVLVGDIASVRADSTVVSWLNVRVTHQVQDTSSTIRKPAWRRCTGEGLE